jgi:hypothetical protein
VTEISDHPLSAKVEIKTKLDNVFIFDLVEVKSCFAILHRIFEVY